VFNVEPEDNCAYDWIVVMGDGNQFKHGKLNFRESVKIII